MAYFIFQENCLHSIAANDTDKNSLPLVDTYIIKEVSDIDYAKVRKHISNVKLESGNVVIEDSDGVSTRYENENFLRNYHTDSVIKKINEFLDAGNEDKSLYSVITDYKTYLENFDYSAISFPMTKTWEEYCEDNAITYVSPLQIP